MEYLDPEANGNMHPIEILPYGPIGGPEIDIDLEPMENRARRRTGLSNHQI
jgi:hypothetical protein